MVNNMLNTLAKQQMEAVTKIHSWKINTTCTSFGNLQCAQLAPFDPKAIKKMREYVAGADEFCESRTSGFKDLNEFKEKFQLAIHIGGYCSTFSLKNMTIGILIDRLKDDDEDVRREAADALGEITSAATIPQSLMELLEDEDKDVRSFALDELGKIYPVAAVPQLIETLKDDDEGVRWSAVKALSKFGPLAVPQLIETLKDDDEDVRKTATEALVMIGPAAKKELRRASYDVSERLYSGDIPIGSLLLYQIAFDPKTPSDAGDQMLEVIEDNRRDLERYGQAVADALRQIK